MATRGWGLVSLYIWYNFKNSGQKLLDWFQSNLAEMFLWWPSTKIVQAIIISQKNMATKRWGLFSLYIYIEKFKKNFLSETNGLISV